MLTSVSALLAGALLIVASPASASQRQVSAPASLAQLAVQQARLVAPDGVAGDFFGLAVALSGDTALVGAGWDDPGSGSLQGSAYVFVRSGASWTLQQKLTAPDGDPHDEFGLSVALSGDTALIGAHWDDVGGNLDQGSAYVFTRANGTWSLPQKLVAPRGAAFDAFGSAVALAGDTALIGAPGDTVDGKLSQGSASVFRRSGSTWNFSQMLVSTDGSMDDQFGGAVALSGDTALIGAPYDDVGAVDEHGSAYVFTRAGTAWTQQQQLSPAGAAAEDRAAGVVAIDGDTALIGVSRQDAGGEEEQGAAYVFTRTGTVWAQQQVLTAVGGGDHDFFGESLAISGDRLVVGAPWDHADTRDFRGSAYVFTRSGTTWTQQDRLSGDGPGTDDAFGGDVAIDGHTVLAGAMSDDVDGRADQGSAYAFLLQDSPPTTTAELSPPPNAAGWYRTPVDVVLAAAAGTFALAGTEYRVSGAADWTSYAAPFQVATEGVSTWEFRSLDVVGNVEPAKSLTFRIDTRKPSTEVYDVSVDKGGIARLAYRVNDALPGCARATATLRIYKGQQLMKTLNSGWKISNVRRIYGWLCTLAPGAYKIKAFATDLAGNTQATVGEARLTVK